MTCITATQKLGDVTPISDGVKNVKMHEFQCCVLHYIFRKNLLNCFVTFFNALLKQLTIILQFFLKHSNSFFMSQTNQVQGSVKIQ
jgi:hypothetical protein